MHVRHCYLAYFVGRGSRGPLPHIAGDVRLYDADGLRCDCSGVSVCMGLTAAYVCGLHVAIEALLLHRLYGVLCEGVARLVVLCDGLLFPAMSVSSLWI